MLSRYSQGKQCVLSSTGEMREGKGEGERASLSTSSGYSKPWLCHPVRLHRSNAHSKPNDMRQAFISGSKMAPVK